jgi:hypothetical protein
MAFVSSSELFYRQLELDIQERLPFKVTYEHQFHSNMVFSSPHIRFLPLILLLLSLFLHFLSPSFLKHCMTVMLCTSEKSGRQFRINAHKSKPVKHMTSQTLLYL